MKKNTNYNFDKIRIILVNTSESGNIGAVARAMKTMNLSRLYLVNPSDYPSAKATARASGADGVLFNSIVCQSVEQALSGTHLVIATSTRKRHIRLKQMDVIDTCALIQKTVLVKNQEVAVVFGTESSGLSNKDIDFCHMLMTIPANDDYLSLNLASAVQIFAYQNFISNTQTEFINNSKELASFNELESFYTHLQQILKHIDYFDNKRPQELLMRRLRHFFNKAEPEKKELGILRGILKKIKPFKVS